MGKFRIWLDVLGKITIGVLFSSASFITLCWGREADLQIELLWQIIFVSLMCSLGILVDPTDGKREVSKIGMITRHIIYFVYVNACVLGFGSVFEWFMFSDWKMVVLMEILIVIVFALITLVSYLNDAKTAQNMNNRLNKKQEESRIEKRK